MESRCGSRRAPITRVVGTVVRQFAGSRIERQLVAQVFDLVWQGSGGGTLPEVAHAHSENLVRFHNGRMAAAAAAQGVTP